MNSSPDPDTAAPRNNGCAVAASRVISCPSAAGTVLLALLAGACSYKAPVLPISEAHLTADKAAKGEREENILSPVSVPTPPPPRPQPRLPTYSVVVNEVPVKELLLALARDTKQNIDVHPGLQGLVSLNAIDETLPSILDRIAKQGNLRWRQDGRTILVSPDTPYVKTYKVNYVNVSRETQSTVGVSGLVGTGAATGGGATGGAGGGAGSNASSTTVNTVSKNEFWKVLEENVKGMLSATRAQALSADERSARAEAAKAQREERIAQAEAVARAGANATDLMSKAFDSQQSSLPGDVANEVVVNAVAGTVTILATDRQHGLVQQYLDAVMSASQRQVLIEATIVEVELSHQYQAGVDWGRIAGSAGAGLSIQQNFVSGILNNPPNFQIRYADAARPGGGVFAAIKLLEQFGNTRVLSSPKLMALNNQTALLKVVRNQVYFQIQSSISQGTVGVGALQSVQTTARTVPIGLVMSMTPQINETGQITITVRPTVTSQVGTVEDPNPVLAAQNLKNLVPIIEVREIESVLQVVSGQTAILGGLIKDEMIRTRSQIPGIGNTRAGDLFAVRDETARKTELVIFLRPTVVTNPSLDADDLRFLRPLLPKPEQLGALPDAPGTVK
jgi:general secretion pathway protein D